MSRQPSADTGSPQQSDQIAKLKRLTTEQAQQIQGGYWTASSLTLGVSLPWFNIVQMNGFQQSITQMNGFRAG